MLKAAFVDLKNRLLVSVVLVALLTSLVYFSNHAVVKFGVMLAVAAVAIAAMWEYVMLLRTKDISQPLWLLFLLAAVFVFANYLYILSLSLSVVLQLVVIAFFFAVFLNHFSKVEGAIVSIATAFFGAFYIVVPLGLILRILYPETISTVFTDGRLWLAYLISVTKIIDIGGYFIGKLWGKSKLAPHLSPGKTLMGAIGGFVAAVLLSIVFFCISRFCPPNVFRLTFVQALILGGLIGIFGQLGDLAESLLKRDAAIKDSNQIPGIGGVLDMLDSLLFTIPIVYIYLKFYSL